MSDSIDHPAHYNDYSTNFCGLETIETIEQLGFGFQFCIANAIKYLDRAGKKPGVKETSDIEKAHWYVDRALMNPTELQSYAQLGTLKSCLSALADFDTRKAKMYMQSFISMGLGQ